MEIDPQVGQSTTVVRQWQLVLRSFLLEAFPRVVIKIEVVAARCQYANRKRPKYELLLHFCSYCMFPPKCRCAGPIEGPELFPVLPCQNWPVLIYQLSCYELKLKFQIVLVKDSPSGKNCLYLTVIDEKYPNPSNSFYSQIDVDLKGGITSSFPKTISSSSTLNFRVVESKEKLSKTLPDAPLFSSDSIWATYLSENAVVLSTSLIFNWQTILPVNS